MIPHVLANFFPLLGAIIFYARLPALFILAIIGLVWIFTVKARGSIDMAKHRVLPGPPPLPLVGNLMEFSGKYPNYMIESCMRLVKRYGPVVGYSIGPYPRALVTCSEGFRVIMDNQKYSNKGEEVYRLLKPFLGEGLITSNGTKWHDRRKLLTPAFHFKILKDFMSVINEQAKVLVDEILPRRDLSKPVDICPLIVHCALDIICEAAMGKNTKSQLNPDAPYPTAVKRLSQLLVKRAMNPLVFQESVYRLHPDYKEYSHCLKTVHNFTDEMIRLKKKQFKDCNTQTLGHMSKTNIEDTLIGMKKKLAFLDLIIEVSDDGKVLSDADIREEVDTITFAAHDTTAASIYFTLYMLALHPHFMARVEDEIFRTFGHDAERPVTMEDLPSLKYLECFIKETMRVCPSVTFISRECNEDVMIENHIIPAGTEILLFIHGQHRNPDDFPDPEVFDPDRFSQENVTKRSAYAYVPFSAGSRNCLGQKFAGMEQKVVISTILRHFTIRPAMERKEFERNLRAEIILRPSKGIPLYFDPRKKL